MENVIVISAVHDRGLSGGHPNVGFTLMTGRAHCRAHATT
ncbi:hypothetical protein SAMN05192539_102028 [Paraburkholderia diazotrophica]|uniref:Uncharacterized protein n=1 Tax=Paraburkholderia diazotrophica TaxID=667676 RepID=A0A1H7CAB8_9BURK|nr:hypothetical protein SAMN05192539_102028 [Paraburkholderia diazotrophica]